MSMSLTRAEFTAFLMEAKRHTYAAQGDNATVTPLIPGSRQLEYRQGNLLYRDVYYGSAFFAGHETVFEEDIPMWVMSYAGGVTSADLAPATIRSVYSFLRAALRHVEPARPFRGPHQWREGLWIYTDNGEGDIVRFHGDETITYQGELVYTLHYAGGLLK